MSLKQGSQTHIYHILKKKELAGHIGIKIMSPIVKKSALNHGSKYNFLYFDVDLGHTDTSYGPYVARVPCV